MVTLALAQIVYYAFYKAERWTGGENGLRGIQVPAFEVGGQTFDFLNPVTKYYVILVFVALALWCVSRLLASPFGAVIEAVRENEQRAAACGYDVARTKLRLFVVSASICGLAGGLRALHLSVVPIDSLHYLQSGQAVMMCLLGGMGTSFGPFIGAGLFLTLEDVATTLTTHWMAIVGAVFMVFALFFPAGGVGHADEAAGAGGVMDVQEPILEVQAVSKHFGNFVALNAVSASFQAGKLAAVIGPNGAGKSTFFNVVSGAFAPSAGRLKFQGRDITGLAQHEFARTGIAKSFQITNVFKQLSAFENVRVAAQMRHSRYQLFKPRAAFTELAVRADTLLERVGLADLRKKTAADLAHGQQRALEVAMALAAEPVLLRMDEPTAGMSPEETRVMMDLITTLAAERTVILVEHKMKLMMGICERLLVLHHGHSWPKARPTKSRPMTTCGASIWGKDEAMWTVEKLNAWYDRSHVVQGLSFEVSAGEIVTLMGRNGAGKTSTLRAIMGLMHKREGSVRFDGRKTAASWPASRCARTCAWA